jgi:tRNA pseudouridine55 synthase
VRLTDELAKRFLNGQRVALGKEDVALPEQLGRVRVHHGDKLLDTALLQKFSILAPEGVIAYKVV